MERHFEAASPGHLSCALLQAGKSGCAGPGQVPPMRQGCIWWRASGFSGCVVALGPAAVLLVPFCNIGSGREPLEGLIQQT